MPKEVTHEWSESCPFCQTQDEHERVRQENDDRVRKRQVKHQIEEKYHDRREETPSWARR